MRSLVLAAAALACAAQAATPGPLSWGKPGVSFDQYRTDALACGRSGYYLDVSGTEAAHVFKDATSNLKANETDLSTPGPALVKQLDTVIASQHVIDNTQPQRRFAEVRQLMQGTVDQCLAQRGYLRFRLTPGQARDLARYRFGTDARRQFLYRLASDPRVLATQPAA